MKNTLRSLPLTLLAWEGPQARLYALRLARMGFVPERTVLLALTRHPGTGRPVGRLLPRGLRTAWAVRSQEAATMHWPRWLQARHGSLFEKMAQTLNEAHPGAQEDLERSLPRFDWTAYPHFETCLVSGLRDPRLADRLAGAGTILFTGGGIVPKTLLETPGARFLHVHPGRLPLVRGADGLLWSMLIRDRPGVSAFFLAPGIDTGDVIEAVDLDPLVFDLSSRHPRPDDTTLYRSLFSFYDPLMRADFLARLLRDRDVETLETSPQDEIEGTTYHFLHRDLKRIALARVFRGGA